MTESNKRLMLGGGIAGLEMTGIKIPESILICPGCGSKYPYDECGRVREGGGDWEPDWEEAIKIIHQITAAIEPFGVKITWIDFDECYTD